LNVMVPPPERPTYSEVGLSGLSPAVSMALVTKTWSPHTIGELHERPGIAAVQTIPLSELQLSGSSGSSGATPFLAPRNCGQLSAVTATVPKRIPRSAQAEARISITGE
jgi:hypothetical protein